jgi:hypothetical protein
LNQGIRIIHENGKDYKMKRIQIVNQLPVENQTQAKSHGTIAGSQSQTSGSHGNKVGHQGKPHFLPFTFSLLPFIALCSLLICLGCEQPDSGNNNSNNGDVSFVDFSFAPEKGAFVLQFDKNIEGLSAEDITLAIRDGSGAADESFTPAIVSGPDAEHRYTLKGRFTGSSADGKNATATLTKEGFTFTGNARSAAIEFITVSLMSISADPDPTTTTKTTKLIFQFDKNVPNLSEDDITIFQYMQVDPPVLTRKLSGMVKREGTEGIYELPVRCMGSLATPGQKGQTLTIAPNGYKFLYQPGLANLGGTGRGFRIYYEASPVSGVTLTLSPDTAVISDESWSSPKTWTLTAAVSYTARDDDANAAFSIENAPLIGVTLTDNGNGTATLSIVGTVTAGMVTVRATAVEDDEKTAIFQVSIDKNAPPVTGNDAFNTALSGAGNHIVIASINAQPITIIPQTTALPSTKRISVRQGGILFVENAWTANGTINIENGGIIKIKGGTILTVTTPGKICFGGESGVTLLSGTYNSAKSGKDIILSYDETTKEVIVGGDAITYTDVTSSDAVGAVLFITLNPAGTTSSYKYINFPVGYSLVIGKDMLLRNSNAYTYYNFGNTPNTATTGFAGNVRARGGDAVLSALSNGVALKAKQAGAYIEYTGNIYCAKSNEIQFPAADPLKIQRWTINATSYQSSIGSTDTLEISSAGGTKISVPSTATAGFAMSNNLSTLPASSTTIVNFGLIGEGSGTLDFTVRADKTQTVSAGVTINLGGSGSNELGRILLTNGAGTTGTAVSFSAATSGITTGNADASTTFSNFSLATVTKDTITLKGTTGGILGSIISVHP